MRPTEHKCSLAPATPDAEMTCGKCGTRWRAIPRRYDGRGGVAGEWRWVRARKAAHPAGSAR